MVNTDVPALVGLVDELDVRRRRFGEGFREEVRALALEQTSVRDTDCRAHPHTSS